MKLTHRVFRIVLAFDSSPRPGKVKTAENLRVTGFLPLRLRQWRVRKKTTLSRAGSSERTPFSRQLHCALGKQIEININININVGDTVCFNLPLATYKRSTGAASVRVALLSLHVSSLQLSGPEREQCSRKLIDPEKNAENSCFYLGQEAGSQKSRYKTEESVLSWNPAGQIDEDNDGR